MYPAIGAVIFSIEWNINTEFLAPHYTNAQTYELRPYLYGPHFLQHLFR